MKQFISGATIILAATLILTACGGRNYEINLVPTEGKIYRELKTIAKEKDETLKIDHFRKAYPNYTKNDGTSHTWSGVFEDNMPSEFGGFGRFHSLSNNMGSVSLYIERYSGSDDIAGQLQESWTAIDILVDHMIGWLDTQIKQEKGYTTLRQFLDKTLRQDLKNLGVYVFQLQISELIGENDSTEKFRNEMFARFSLYLVERGYFKISDLPAMMKFASSLQKTEDEEIAIIMMDSMVRFLAGKMGLTDKEPLPEFLESLKNPENLEGLQDSYLNYFKQTEYYKKQLKNSPELRESDPDVITDKIMSRLIESIINPSLFHFFGSGPDRIKVNIHNLPKATLSNGKWDKRKMIWEGPLDGENAANERGLPAFSYAVWDQPNKTFQEKHFGEVAFEDENLLQYCLWHASLFKAEAKEWDEFTAKLKPSTIDKQLEQANFSEGLSKRLGGLEGLNVFR